MFYRIPYPNKCVCSHQNCQATSILSGDITVLRFRRPSWMPSWIVEKTPLGFTGILGMLFLVVLRMFPEKFSFGISFAPSEPNALRLVAPTHPPPPRTLSKCNLLLRGFCSRRQLLFSFHTTHRLGFYNARVCIVRLF